MTTRDQHSISPCLFKMATAVFINIHCICKIFMCGCNMYIVPTEHIATDLKSKLETDRQTDRQTETETGRQRMKESINHSINEWLLFVHGVSINSNKCFNGMNGALWVFLYLYRMKIICIYDAFSASSMLVTKYVKVTHQFFLNFCARCNKQ